ncbi:MAG TPA: protein kinase [Mycobacteriales bacterium]|nr:protein kinase [Mycobacteriales bacterium]
MIIAQDAVLGDRYTLLVRIAGGGMGEVWRARDGVLDRTVAVKLLRADLGDDEHFRLRFRDEAKNTAALSHPGIANVFDYGEQDGLAYLVMELVDGEPLSTVLQREGPLPPAQALGIVGQAALALQSAHDAGVVHRDVKPGNLLIRSDGVVKVTDFGIARNTSTAAITQTGLVLGTAHYLSPEQAEGQPATAASDLYALGVVAYEALSGGRPFTGDNAVGIALAHIRAEVPPLPSSLPEPIREFVARAMARDPAQRFADGGEMGRTALALSGRTEGMAAAVPVLAPAGARAPGAATPTRQLTAGTPGRLTPIPTTLDRERRRVRRIFIGIGGLVVILGFFTIRACATTPTARVPTVIGTNQAAAVSALKHAGFAVVTTTVTDQNHARGTVLTESPKPGSLIDQGSRVTLTLAAGPQLVTVNPAAAIGQPYPTVAATLVQLGLAVREVTTPVGGVPPDTVVGVGPSGSVLQGSTVTLTVASAPGPPGPGKPGKGNGGDNGH